MLEPVVTLGSRIVDMPHVAERVFGTPIAMLPSKLEAILSSAPYTAGPAKERDQLDVGTDGIAAISIEGTLVRRGGFAAMSGMSTYASLSDEIDQAASDPRVQGVLLAIDSPGGEVAGLFDLVAKVEALAEAKPVFAVADEEAYSAAYAIACAADCVYVARTGGVGSVGVVALHVDQSGADAKRGLKYTYIHAGAKKVDGHSHAPISDRALSDLQAEVDRLRGIFSETVASNRGMSASEVMDTEAGTFMGQAAVDAGLADRVGTVEDARAGLRAEIEARRNQMNFAAQIRSELGFDLAVTDEQVIKAWKDDRAALQTAKAEGEGFKASLATAKTLSEKLDAEKSKLTTRVAELEAGQANERHTRVVERVDGLRERGARVDEHLTQEDRADVVAALESSNDREHKLGESLLTSFRSRIEAAEKTRGAKPQASSEGVAKIDLSDQAELEERLRAQGFDQIAKDAHGRVILDECSTPEGRKRRGTAAK